MAHNITIDSSVLVSSLIKDEKFSEISRQFISFLKDKNYRVHIPMTVLLEVLKVYHRKVKSMKSFNILYQRLIDWNITKKLVIINIEGHFLVKFTELQHLYDLKTADAIIATAAHSLGYPLITWDEKMLRECRKKMVCMTPQIFLRQQKKSRQNLNSDHRQNVPQVSDDQI